MKKECEQQSSQEALHLLRNQLTMIRGNAQLLIRRLDREHGHWESNKDACQTIIDQTRLVEGAIDRLVSRSADLQRENATPVADRES